MMLQLYLKFQMITSLCVSLESNDLADIRPLSKVNSNNLSDILDIT